MIYGDTQVILTEFAGVTRRLCNALTITAASGEYGRAIIRAEIEMAMKGIDRIEARLTAGHAPAALIPTDAGPDHYAGIFTPERSEP